MHLRVLILLAAGLVSSACQLEQPRGVLPTGTGVTSSGGLVPGQVEH